MQRGTSLQYSATPEPFSIVPLGSPGSWLVPCYSPSLPSEIGSASGSTRHDYWVGGGRRKKGRGERREKIEEKGEGTGGREGERKKEKEGLGERDEGEGESGEEEKVGRKRRKRGEVGREGERNGIKKEEGKREGEGEGRRDEKRERMEE